MIKGKGYQEYKRMRMLNENLTATQIEKAGNERYLIYFGRAHLKDHEFNVLVRGDMKIGRGKFATALQRGRNQSGIDFRIYAEIILDSNKATHDAEAILKDILSHRHLKYNQGQAEMYNINDNELETTVKTVAEVISNETSHNVLEINFYHEELV